MSIVKETDLISIEGSMLTFPVNYELGKEVSRSKG
jgi:hypothetical protein